MLRKKVLSIHMKRSGISKMKKICVIGANGFVGRAICEEVEKREGLQLIKITREDNMESLCLESDLIIHSANSPRRFFANQNRLLDLSETMEKMLNIIKISCDKKIVLISTVSSRVQQDTPYGSHRRACELLLNHEKDLIFRLGDMFGGNNKKGYLFDIIEGNNVYASAKTKCAYVDVRYNAFKIVELMEEKTGLVELGARNSIELEEIAKRINSKCKFVGGLATQLPVEVPNDAPSANLVLKYIEKQLRNKK